MRQILGKRNLNADARELAVTMKQRSMRTTSALDYWDQLTTLHYGGRHHVTDHFRYVAATLTDYWAWAGAPFAAPAAVTLEDSLLKVNMPVAGRAFLVYDIAAVPTGCKLASVALWANTVGVACGLRIDDGTDNNYAEVVLRVSAVNPTQWAVQRRSRVGGGAVTTNNGDAMTIPTAMVLHMHLSGTKWSDWGIDSYLHTPFGITGTMYKETAARSATWTPTRCGLVFDNLADQSVDCNGIVDWVDLDSDDEWLGA
jgi:hypothetical protein